MTLFPEPEQLPHALSRMYDTATYRARKGRRPRWNKYTPRKPCDECFAVQHEAGATGLIPRSRNFAAQRRSIPGGPDLLLCGAHATLWRERDEA